MRLPLSSKIRATSNYGNALNSSDISMGMLTSRWACSRPLLTQRQVGRVEKRPRFRLPCLRPGLPQLGLRVGEDLGMVKCEVNVAHIDPFGA